MKKFKFSLEPLQKYKKTLEKQEKAALAKVMAELNRLLAALEHLDAGIAANQASLLEAMECGEDIVAEMERHDNYLRYLQEQRKTTLAQIAKVEEQKLEIQAKLVVLMKELKALDRLRAEQYKRYLDELRKDEEKAINDLISHQQTADMWEEQDQYL